MATALYKLAKSHSPNFSLDLHTQTPVTSISPSPSSNLSRRCTVNTPRGTITCSYIIHATNGYASHLLPQFTGPGPQAIIPTRGQVLALRVSVPTEKLGKSAWVANDGFEYWFPRPTPKGENPLVIFGGGREYELYNADDGVLNEDVSKALSRFLPVIFEGKYEEGREPEMEWVCLEFRGN